MRITGATRLWLTRNLLRHERLISGDFGGPRVGLPPAMRRTLGAGSRTHKPDEQGEASFDFSFEGVQVVGDEWKRLASSDNSRIG
jgi:hypothetical protein